MKALLLAGVAMLALTQVATAQSPNPPAPAAPAVITAHRSVSETGMFVTIPSSTKLSSEFVGLAVYNDDNKDIGTIKDVAMMTNGGQAYILSVGGFLGMGTRYIAVNPSNIHVTYNDASKKLHATMNATVDQLKAAPEFKYVGAWAASKS